MKKLLVSFLLLPALVFGYARVATSSGFNKDASDQLSGVFGGIFEQANHSGSLGMPAYHAFYDSTDPLMYPHTSIEHGNQMQFFYAGTNSYRGFGIVKIMDNLAIGFADEKANRVLRGINPDTMTDPLVNPDELSAHSYSLFAAYGVGNMTFGIAFDIWDSQNNKEYENVQADPNYTTKDPWIDSNIFDVKLSMGMDLGGGSGFDALLAFTFGMYTYETYDSRDNNAKTRLKTEDDGIFSVTVGGRYYMTLMEGLKLTVWGFIDFGSEGVKIVDYDAGNNDAKYNERLNEISGMLLNFGASAEIVTLNKKITLRPYLGILYGSNSLLVEDLNDINTNNTKGSTVETTTTLTALPYAGVAVEYALFDWFTLYSGYSKIVGSKTQEVATKNYANTATNSQVTREDTTTTVNDYAGSGFTVGFAIHNDDLALIANLNTDFLLNGPDFISGTETNQMIGYLTFEWKFDLPFGTPRKTVKPAGKKAAPAVKDIKKAAEIKKVKTDSDDDIE